MKKKNLSHDDLRSFHGDTIRYRSVNPLVIYTPGVKHVADAGDAYWLVETIACYFGFPEMNKATASDSRIETLQFWRLDVHADNSATLTARADSDAEPFITQEIPFTDFPLSHVDIWAGKDIRHWVLYLPSEH